MSRPFTTDLFANFLPDYRNHANYAALKASILTLKRCTAKLIVWNAGDKKHLIDGFMRLSAVDELRADGHEIAEPDIEHVAFDDVGAAKEFIITHGAANRPNLTKLELVETIEKDADLQKRLKEQADEAKSNGWKERGKKNLTRKSPQDNATKDRAPTVAEKKAAMAGMSRDTYEEAVQVLTNPQARMAVERGENSIHSAAQSLQAMKKKHEEEQTALKHRQVLPDWTNKHTSINTVAHCDILTRFPLLDKCIDLIVTSVPYPVPNTKVQYIEPFFDVRVEHPYQDYLGKIRFFIRECYRVMKPGRYCVINVDNCGPIKTDRERGIRQYNCFVDFCTTASEVGFTFSDVHHWYKQNCVSNRGPMMGTRDNPRGQRNVEFIIVLWKPEEEGTSERPPNLDLTTEEHAKLSMSFWDISPASARKEQHPCAFPLALPDRCVRLYSRRGEVVCDPFNGSGTTCVAAILNGRQYVGLEINKVYCERAEARIEEAKVDAAKLAEEAATAKPKELDFDDQVKKNKLWRNKRNRFLILQEERAGETAGAA